MLLTKGRDQCLPLGIAQRVIWKRLSRGWSPKRVLITPTKTLAAPRR